MIKNGISEENLTKLFTHAQLAPKDQDMVRNLSFLGVNVIADVSTSRCNCVHILILFAYCSLAKRSIAFHAKNA